MVSAAVSRGVAHPLRRTAAPLLGAALVVGLAGLAPAASAGQTRSAATVLAQMSEAQRVGQLFMVGTPATAPSASTLAAIGTYHVGNVVLTGRSYGGTATPARVSAAMQSRTTRAATSGVRLLVAADQEGGLVQVVNGPGVSRMPSALDQGHLGYGALLSAATTWGRQLRASGVNMDLAPVMDTVPSPAAARLNPPIGRLQREFGFTPALVSSRGTAFALGMAAGGVAPTIKHFPGLGRVSANTDVASGVTDWSTRRGDAYLVPFKTAISAGHVPFVMMSTAYYAGLDRANPAAFSPFVINTILRGDLGFTGVVVSDDLASARQVSPWSYGDRAVKFINAGGDMVLTVSPATLPAMYDAVLARAGRDPAFRAKVDRAALRVLQAKQARGLLGS